MLYYASMDDECNRPEDTMRSLLIEVVWYLRGKHDEITVYEEDLLERAVTLLPLMGPCHEILE